MNNENRENHENLSIPVLIIKVLITVLFISPLLHYTMYQITDDESVEKTIGNQTITVERVNRTIKKVVEQPSCPRRNQKLILQRLCVDLFRKHQQCTQDDFANLAKHQLPKIIRKIDDNNNSNNNNNNKESESRGMIISCFIGGLLLTSLCAALIELYKAKNQTNQQKLNNLNKLNRKCSLADLTVLKHNRKELIRRDSIMDIPEYGNGPSTNVINNKQLMGRKVSRPPLRLD